MKDLPTTRGRRQLRGFFLVPSCLAVSGTLLAEVERRSEETMLFGHGEVVPDDIYAAGETVSIQGTVLGDQNRSMLGRSLS